MRICREIRLRQRVMVTISCCQTYSKIKCLWPPSAATMNSATNQITHRYLQISIIHDLEPSSSELLISFLPNYKRLRRPKNTAGQINRLIFSCLLFIKRRIENKWRFNCFNRFMGMNKLILCKETIAERTNNLTYQLEP